MSDNSKQLVIVTGLSGSGKSIAIRALEDQGFFCIDNLPLVLFDKLIDLLVAKQTAYDRFALVMDTRDARLIEQGQTEFEKLGDPSLLRTIVYLDSSDDALIRRYKETRRKHPMAKAGTVREGIALEREKLAWIRQMADNHIDTSDMNVHQLEHRMSEMFSSTTGSFDMNVNLLTFGFKYGLPSDADLVMDVRFLPNPYWVEDLKDLTGIDPKVKDYIFSFEQTNTFVNQYWEMLQFLLPYYGKEGKHYLTLAIGCTGGKHRSVAIAEALKAKFKGSNFSVTLYHRDIKKVG
jgi:UPF0042 nucleotide-binding protein